MQKFTATKLRRNYLDILWIVNATYRVPRFTLFAMTNKSSFRAFMINTTQQFVMITQELIRHIHVGCNISSSRFTKREDIVHHTIFHYNCCKEVAQKNW